MSGILLFNSSSEDEEVSELPINEDFAKRYNHWREKEEKEKLKARYGTVNDEEYSDSSSESSESPDETELEKNDKYFYRTLSMIMNNDSRINDPNFVFYPEENDKEKPSKAKKEKPMFWKDQERKILLEKEGVFSDDEMGRPGPNYLLDKEQQLKFKKEAKESFAVSSDSDDEFLKEKVLSKKEKETQEADYVEWLKGNIETITDQEYAKDTKCLRQHWNDPNLNEDDKFLRDFFLNKGYFSKGDPNEMSYNHGELDVEDLSEDEKTLEKQEIFEHKFNFRYEEPDPEFIKSFPRTVGDTMRKENERRKIKRKEISQRKKQEKEKKKEELTRLRALQLKEIEEKIEKLKKTSGNTEITSNLLDLDEDFNSEDHDKKMQKMFGDEYYGEEADAKKPVFSSDEELDDENWDDWTGEVCENSNDEHNDDTDYQNTSVNMNADPKMKLQTQLIESTKRKKGKKKSRFAEILALEKPKFDPNEKSFESYVEDYYKLHCEDFIGDMPVRFSYRSVIPNDFGLSVEEVLSSDDKELNRWCSVKKTCQYRTEEEENQDVQKFCQKAKCVEKKKKILLHAYQEEVETSAKKKIETEKKQEKSLISNSTGDILQKNLPEDSAVTKIEYENKQSSNCRKKKKKNKKEKYSEHLSETTYAISNSTQYHKKHQNKKTHENNFDISDARLRAYGINPKKHRNKLKWKKQH